MVGAAVVGVLGATGATVAYGGGDGRAGSSDGLVCVGSGSHDLVMRFDPRTDDPLTACAAEWEQVFGVPAPPVLTACVDASEQGSIEVRPGPVEVCAEHGDLPYTGPTDEQLRYAAFLDEAEVLGARAEAKDVACLSYEDLRAALDALLAEHSLPGWTYGFAGTDPRPQGCMRPGGGLRRPQEADRGVGLRPTLSYASGRPKGSSSCQVRRWSSALRDGGHPEVGALARQRRDGVVHAGHGVAAVGVDGGEQRRGGRQEVGDDDHARPGPAPPAPGR